MHDTVLSNIAADIGRLPKAGDPAASDRGLDKWRVLLDRLKTDQPDLATALDQTIQDRAAKALLEAVFGNSPYLSQCLLREPDVLSEFMADGPETTFEVLLASVSDVTDSDTITDNDLAARLRTAKRRASLLIGLADVAGLWTAAVSARALSRFADAAIDRAAGYLLAKGIANGDIEPAGGASGGECGLIILGMGKLGGEELNYSSDIDLIILFDDSRVTYTGRRSLQDFFVRLTQRLVALLHERTGEGYVFRTDLRLRPDPNATPVALSVAAAETYYESIGQNWERAAMIKARPVAADKAAGTAFLDIIRPFIWRRNLDFATIRDIQSIKHQIHAHRGGGEIAVNGHNIKLGRGGIREIEFFAQTQQLIWGGRYPELRTHSTIEALDVLADLGRITREVEAEMHAAYWYLRQVEHRLQMVDDRQTHDVPEDDAELERLAIFLGYASADVFATELTAHLRRVALHYSELFDDSPALSAPIEDGGSLVFTGVEDDPETLKTLERMGFQRGSTVAGLVREWHRGRMRATRSDRTRQILTRLIPTILHAFGHTIDPDAAFLKFNDFLTRLPAGVQLFSLFEAHPHLLDLVAEIMGSAPRLADYLSQRAQLLDAVLADHFFDELPTRQDWDAALTRDLATAPDFQDCLDIARRWAGDAKFQISVQQLRGTVDVATAGNALSDVADLTVRSMLHAVEDEFAHRYGRIAGAEFAVLGYGKLGSRMLTRGSDLDLVFAYQVPNGSAMSDGERGLDPPTYFARLCQRLVTAISAQTGEGQLYEIDLRLRPMGNDGPMASEFGGLERYYRDDAWTWEFMALTRARVIIAPDALTAKIQHLIGDALIRPRPAGPLAAEVVEMRSRIEKEHGTKNPWSIKHVRGGLVDVEFIAQYQQLCLAGAHPEVLDTNTSAALGKLGSAAAIDPDDAVALIAAANFYHAVQAALRLCLQGAFDEDTAPNGLRQALVRAGEAVDFDDLKRKLLDHQTQVRALFERYVEAAADRQPATA